MATANDFVAKKRPVAGSEWFEDYEHMSRVILLAKHIEQYKMIVATIDEIAGPEPEPDAVFVDWERATFNRIAHALYGRMSRETVRKRLNALVEAGVIDSANKPRDYLPRYTHILERVAEEAAKGIRL